MIALWTGRRASTFRVAYRLSAEAFAGRLGVAPRTIANWDADPDPDPGPVPTPALQEALDSLLDDAPWQVRARLAVLLAEPAAGLAGPAEPGSADAAAGAMQAFRLADLTVGGGHLYRAVMSYLRDQVAPQLMTGPGSAVFVAAG